MSDIETRAGDANALNDNPLLRDILEQVKREAVSAWLSTSREDKEAREFAWLLHKAINRIEVVLQGAIDDGIIAAKRATAPLR